MEGTEWNAGQYLRFERERTQPVRDLLSHIDMDHPQDIIDLGCGPGNSTQALAQRYPDAHIVGVDFSPNMLERARGEHPHLSFCSLDLTDTAALAELRGRYDLVFSNACIHWVPNHYELVPRLLGLLRPKGVLAVQVPQTYRQIMYNDIVGPLVRTHRWHKLLGDVRQQFFGLEAAEYYDILVRAGSKVEWLWETTYMQIMPSHEDILEWYRGTGLRPYLSALDIDSKKGTKRPDEVDGPEADGPDEADGPEADGPEADGPEADGPEADGPEAFLAQVLADLRKTFPTRVDGSVVLPIPRLFYVARISRC